MLRVVPSGSLDEDTRRKLQVSRRRFRLARLLRSTEEILTHAQVGDWEEVEKQEYLRQMELAACFSETDHDDSQEVIEALAALVHMNKEITRLVAEARQQLIAQQQAAEVRHEAVKRYDWYE